MKPEDTVMGDSTIFETYINCHITHSEYTDRQRRRAIAKAQAEITWAIALKEGRREVVEWLKDYAIHGGQTKLVDVLFDMEAHSPFIRGLKWQR